MACQVCFITKWDLSSLENKSFLWLSPSWQLVSSLSLEGPRKRSKLQMLSAKVSFPTHGTYINCNDLWCHLCACMIYPRVEHLAEMFASWQYGNLSTWCWRTLLINHLKDEQCCLVRADVWEIHMVLLHHLGGRSLELSLFNSPIFRTDQIEMTLASAQFLCTWT